MLRFIILFCFFLCSHLAIKAQSFGDISDEELGTEIFNKYSDEDAVVLFDIGNIKISPNFTYEYERHIRIKVLKENGKRKADFKIRYYHEDEFRIKDASTFTPDGEEYELDDDNIYYEKDGYSKTVSFAMPGVTVGSIIEVKYRLYSEIVSSIPTWFFQKDIFTCKSEITVRLPAGFQYSILKKNFEIYDIKGNKNEEFDLYKIGEKLGVFTWTAENLPGIKEDDYIDNVENEYVSLIFLLRSYSAGAHTINFASTWDDIAKRVSKVYESKIDDDVMDEKRFENISGNSASARIKAKNIYSFVRDSIKLIEGKSLFGSGLNDAETILKKKTQTQNESVILLISLLRQAGIKANPVFISTRNNGLINPNFCDTDQFNKNICLANIGGKNCFLNPFGDGDQKIPFGYLSTNTDVGFGLLVDEDKGQIIKIEASTPKNNITIQSEASLLEDYSLQLNSTIIYDGFLGFAEKAKIKKENENDYVKNFVKTLHKNAVVDSFSFSGLDSADVPLTLKLSCTLNNYAEEAGDLLLLSIPMFTKIDKNPFTAEKRAAPIKYKNNSTVSEKITLIEPQGFVLGEIPTQKIYAMDNNIYKLNWSNAEGKNIFTRFRTITQRVFSLDGYPQIKKLYENIISADSYQIVYKKSSLQN